MSTPHFPPLPPNYWSSRSPAAATGFLDQVQRWRGEALAWLTTSRDEGVSDELADFLRWAFGVGPRPAYEISAYVVCAFPTVATERAIAALGADSAPERVQAVLLWRAQIADFLADVWDTIGPPLFDMEECAVAENLFLVELHHHGTYCPTCLTPHAGANGDGAHRASCPVRLPLPPNARPWDD